MPARKVIRCEKCQSAQFADLGACQNCGNPFIVVEPVRPPLLKKPNAVKAAVELAKIPEVQEAVHEIYAGDPLQMRLKFSPGSPTRDKLYSMAQQLDRKLERITKPVPLPCDETNKGKA